MYIYLLESKLFSGQQIKVVFSFPVSSIDSLESFVNYERKADGYNREVRWKVVESIGYINNLT